MADDPESSEGRARRPGGPTPLSDFSRRKPLYHRSPSWVSAGAVFFITLCCDQRGHNQLCRPDLARLLLDAAQFYHDRGRWFIRIFLLMPDHLHALVAFPWTEDKARVVGDWKQYTARHAGIIWQKNFIDHRIRDQDQWRSKAEYIRQNPMRKGLITNSTPWPYVIEH